MSSTNTANPVKFDFGETFDSLIVDEFDTAGSREKTWTEDEVSEERDEAFAKGIAQGRAEALSGLEQQIVDANSRILAKTQSFDSAITDATRIIEDDARQLALTVGRKIGSQLLMQMREEQIELLLADALALLTNEPHVVIRVNEDMVDSFKIRFDTIADERGYKGKLIILGEPDIDEADCRIEWADGGISRDTKQLDVELDKLVSQHLHARGDTFAHPDNEQMSYEPLPETEDKGNFS